MTEFTDYERISDILMYLSSDISLGFVTNFARKDKNGSRSFFHSETKNSTKYNKDVVYIKRQMDYYFIFDNKIDFNDNMILKPQDVIMLLTILESDIFPWFFGKQRIFSIKDDKLIIKGEFNPVNYIQSEYKYLSFLPIVYTFDDGTFKEGIRMYMNGNKLFVDMNIDKFMGLYYILKNTDMYAVACNMAAYAKMPPYDVNIYNPVGLGSSYRNDTAWKEDQHETQSNKQRGNNDFFNNAKVKKERR